MTELSPAYLPFYLVILIAALFIAFVWFGIDWISDVLHKLYWSFEGRRSARHLKRINKNKNKTLR